MDAVGGENSKDSEVGVCAIRDNSQDGMRYSPVQMISLADLAIVVVIVVGKSTIGFLVP